MNRLLALLACTAALLAGTAASGAEVALPPELIGLVRIKPKSVDAAFLLPGADFRGYTKVMIDPPEVAFRKDWMRNMNKSPGRRVTQADAEQIVAAARSGFAGIWEEAFRKAGYEIVTAPGPDVLRISPAIVELYINAPDTKSAGRTTTYTVEAGEAALALQVRDADTGATLGYAYDQRRTRSSGSARWTTSVSNRADFGELFRQWAGICVAAIAELKAASPLPAASAG